MEGFYRVIVDITVDAFRNFTYFIKNSLTTFANILNWVAPYTMYIVGQCVALERNVFTLGGEAFVPIAFIILAYYLRSAANKLGKGVTIPVPEKRFTEVDEDGEVSVEHKRLQELLLYVADVEDWLERKGML